MRTSVQRLPTNFAIPYLDGLELILVKDSGLDPSEVDGSCHLINLAFDEALGQTLHHLNNNRIIKSKTRNAQTKIMKEKNF